jgi:hypothetical protein
MEYDQVSPQVYRAAMQACEGCCALCGEEESLTVMFIEEDIPGARPRSLANATADDVWVLCQQCFIAPAVHAAAIQRAGGRCDACGGDESPLYVRVNKDAWENSSVRCRRCFAESPLDN